MPDPRVKTAELGDRAGLVAEFEQRAALLPTDLASLKILLEETPVDLKAIEATLYFIECGAYRMRMIRSTWAIETGKYRSMSLEEALAFARTLPSHGVQA